MKLLLSIGLMALFHYSSAQTIRLPGSSSGNPEIAFQRFFVNCQESSTYFVELEIFNDEGNIVSKNTAQHYLNKGKNVVSFSQLFDQVSFTDSTYARYYKSHSELPPNEYEAIWKIGDAHKTYFFLVQPKKIELYLERIPVANSDDSIYFSWLRDSSTLENITTLLKWSYVDHHSMNEVQVFNKSDTTLATSPFLPETPILVWVEQWYSDGLICYSKKRTLIPRATNLPVFDSLRPPPHPFTLRDSFISNRPKPWLFLKEHTKGYGALGFSFFGTSNDFSYNYFGKTSLSLNGSAGLDIQGFPVRSNFLINHYQNTGFQIADISFEVDVDRLKRNLENKLREEVASRNRELLAYPELNTDFDTLAGKKLEQQLRSLENDSRFKELKNARTKYSTALEDSLSFLRRNIESVYADSLNALTKKGQDSIGNKRSMLENEFGEYTPKHKSELDSIEQLQQQLQKEYDNFKKLEKQYTTLKRKGIDLYNLQPKDYQDPQLLIPYLPARLKKYGNVLLNVNKLEMGWSHARFSDFTLADKAIRGMNLEYQSENLLFAAVKGTTTNGFMRPNSGLGVPNNTHSINGISFGLAKGEHSTIRANYVDFKDRNDPLSFHSENKVLGISAQQSIYKGVALVGEIAQSYSQHIHNIGTGTVPESPLISLLDFSNSTSRAYSLGLGYKSSKGFSNYSVTLKRIGSGFQTLGNPFLYADRLGVHLQLNQSIWKSKVLLMAKYAREVNNLSQQFTDTGLFHRYQLGAVIRVLKTLTLTSFYMPIRSEFGGVNNLVHTLNSSLDFHEKIGSIKTNLQLNYSYQLNQLRLEETNDQLSEILTINSLFISRKGHSLRMGGALSSSRSLFEQRHVSTSLAFKWSNKLESELYANYQSTSLFGSTTRGGLGIKYRLNNTLETNLRVGYSKIQRASRSLSSEGLDVNFSCRVWF